jgi:superfamily II DNA/RNA helicase
MRWCAGLYSVELFAASNREGELAGANGCNRRRRSCRYRSLARWSNRSSDDWLIPGRRAALVLSPTHELCQQIEDQCKPLLTGLPLRTALVVGGRPLPNQVYRLKSGVGVRGSISKRLSFSYSTPFRLWIVDPWQIIVATPGRLLDVLEKEPSVTLDNIRVLVLDEVDSASYPRCLLLRRR